MARGILQGTWLLKALPLEGEVGFCRRQKVDRSVCAERSSWVSFADATPSVLHFVSATSPLKGEVKLVNMHLCDIATLFHS